MRRTANRFLGDVNYTADILCSCYCIILFICCCFFFGTGPDSGKDSVIYQGAFSGSIDERVVAVCKEYLPGVACSLDDPRVHILYQDGLKYIRRIEDEYDLIIIDSTDPFGPGEGLFTMEFYGNCYKALKEHGVLVNQHESPFYKGDALACQRAHRNIVHSFELSRLFQAHIPTYPSGHWLFGFSSRGVHPVRDLNPDWWNSLGLETRYYNTNLHKGAFYLPNYVQKLLEKVEE